jgi:hypothetical protein
MPKKTLPAKLTISRVSHTRGDDEVRIQVYDEASGCVALIVTVPLAEFASAVTGLAHQPCTAEWLPAPIGKVREHKTVDIRVGQSTRDERSGLLAPYEVDGWKGNASDLVNHHRIRNGVASVGFVRYVEPAEAK